jgi:hypothetical protein
MCGKTAAAAFAVLAMCGSACSAPSQPATAGQRTSAQARVSSAGAAPVSVCFGAMPADWARALHARTVTTAKGVTFAVGAVAGSIAYGALNSAAQSGIAKLDFRTRRLTMISRFPPRAGGMGAMAIDPPWLVWEQTDSRTDLGDWSIHVWNLASGTGSVLATHPRLSNGGDGVGYIPSPVLSNGVAAWAQPTPGPGGYQAEVRAASLATGKVSTLDTGQVLSPVYAGPYLIWGKTDNTGRVALRAADASSFRPVATPGPLRNPGPVSNLGGSPEYLAWSSTANANILTAWPAGAARVLRFTQSGADHPFQFLQLAGHFLLWYTGTGSSVLDLRTGNAFDVQGTLAASADAIAVDQSTVQPVPKGTFAASRVSILAIAEMPGIPRCAR